jgi:hypothetical protein
MRDEYDAKIPYAQRPYAYRPYSQRLDTNENQI